MKRLVIVADNSLIVDAIAIGLRKSSEFDLRGYIDFEAASAQAIAELAPDAILIDDMNQSPRVVDLIGAVARERNGVAMIVLTLAMDSQWLDDVFAAGAVGAISKATHPAALTTLVRETVSGNVLHVSSRHAGDRSARARASAAENLALTPRELEVLQLMAAGSSNGEIAQTLWVTEQTVKFHLSNIYRKLGVANRTEASHYAHMNGLVSARDIARVDKDSTTRDSEPLDSAERNSVEVA
jgi:DNA-binding NarL/FixJ family response regulator